MNFSKCIYCSAHVVPYLFRYDRKGRELSYEEQVHTCKCNYTSFDRPTSHRGSEGFLGYAHPDLCKGANHPYVIINPESSGIKIEFLK